jgi:bile acid:Na+ symporter, BASS family
MHLTSLIEGTLWKRKVRCHHSFTAKVVILPILAGMWFKSKAPKLAENVSRYTPLASVLLVALICGGVVAQTAPVLMTATTAASAAGGAASSGSLSTLSIALVALGLLVPASATLLPILALPFLWRPATTTTALVSTAAKSSVGAVAAAGNAIGLPGIALSVLLLHLLGFGVGYAIPKLLHPNQEKTARTISIEVGMQNSALAVVLARSISGLHPAAALPGAISATVHSCVGSLLAAIWRLYPAKDDS